MVFRCLTSNKNSYSYSVAGKNREETRPVPIFGQEIFTGNLLLITSLRFDQ